MGSTTGFLGHYCLRRLGRQSPGTFEISARSLMPRKPENFAEEMQFFQEEVSFLDFNISRDGVSTNPSKTAAILDWPVPNSAKAVKSFCATVNYYRRHIKDNSTIAAPLYDITKKGCKFLWKREHQIAFYTLKSRLATAPILGIYEQDAVTILDTDASAVSIGAVLSQILDGKERVIAYASRTMNDSERRYSVTKRELLAVLYALKQFRHYLLACPSFTIRTDHAPLVHVQQMKNPSTHIARWLEYMQEYNFTVIHRQGRLHGNADGLSRRGDQDLAVSASNDNTMATDVLRHMTTTNGTRLQEPALRSEPLQAPSEETLLKTPHAERPTQPTSEDDHIPISNLVDLDWANAQRLDRDVAPIYIAKLIGDNKPPWPVIKQASSITKKLWSFWIN
jgi:hypothetical protein